MWKKKKDRLLGVVLLLTTTGYPLAQERPVGKPNVILIYTDDVGFGDISANGAKAIKTPNIDRIAEEGLLFTNAYATSATCTPSRYSMLTGEYAWRKTNTGIAPGNSPLLIPTGSSTLPGIFQQAGYQTGVVGKWHLGLGPIEGMDWNGDIKPGPLEVGFNYSFIIPATGDRVPCVYVENHNIVNLDTADPLYVSYTEQIGNEPNGRDHPELLKMRPSHGHDQSIVNGISRIGYMSGGHSARWIDEEMADVLTHKAVDFIKLNHENPFFLYFATHDIHVPRAPHPRFSGKSNMGPRGDVILQLDGCVGEILNVLEEYGIAQNTIVLFTSDNGPVLDDGYHDQAKEKVGGHLPSGDLRGGKYSAFEGGTRVPMLIKWPQVIKPGQVSSALISQLDFKASFAQLLKVDLSALDLADSRDYMKTLLGKKRKGRQYVIQQSLNNTLSLVSRRWKYISPSEGAKIQKNTGIELGNAPEHQLFDLKRDPGEKNNVAKKKEKIVRKMVAYLDDIVSDAL
ncbi:Arylsulfatase A [Parapedobacter composti]|uniref:Arylsulfatase A n=1 Tax=Parapedobacter composti TaxID=623281 RepID=A0A1I1JSP3_9SPHI|nr:arylsulfatase [Parapedobacter composti]SFC51594.1 Arylsulfatase A [Parapedobacter composti]